MDALFERLDWLYAGLVVLVVLIPSARFRALGALGLGPVLVAAASDRVGGPSGGATFATVNEVLALLGAAVVVVAGVAGVRRGPGFRPGAGFPPSSPQYPDPWLLAGLALAAAAPHLLLLELGILLALLAAIRRTIRQGPRRWLAVLVGGGALIGAALVLMLTILGPEGGGMGALGDGPFSPAAERVLVLLLGAGTLLLAGLPPLSRAPWGLGLSPLAAILMTRLALPALSGGVLDWQPLAMLLLVVAGATAAFRTRWAGFSVAAGLAALCSGVPAGVFAALLLVLWGWLTELAAAGRLGPIRRLRERWAGIPALIPALAALPALEAGLRAQVVLSVVLVAAGVVALAGELVRRPEGAHASHPPHPPLY